MPDGHHGQASGHGLDRLMEFDLAGDECVAATLANLLEAIAPRPTDDSHAAGRTSGIAGELHPRHPERLPGPRRHVGHRAVFTGNARAAKPHLREMEIGPDRRHVGEFEQVGELVVDAAGR